MVVVMRLVNILEVAEEVELLIEVAMERNIVVAPEVRVTLQRLLVLRPFMGQEAVVVIEVRIAVELAEQTPEV